MSLWVLGQDAWWLLTALRLWWYGVYLKDNAILKTFKKLSSLFLSEYWSAFYHSSQFLGIKVICHSVLHSLVTANSSWTNKHSLAFVLYPWRRYKMKGTFPAKLMGFLYILYQRSYCKREGTKGRNRRKAQIQGKDSSACILAKLIQKFKKQHWSLEHEGTRFMLFWASMFSHSNSLPNFKTLKAKGKWTKKDLVCRLIC